MSINDELLEIAKSLVAEIEGESHVGQNGGVYQGSGIHL